jgi:endothelin-converting enzyme/putative endopeptidase
MTRLIEEAMAGDIEQLDWMSPRTKRQALRKLKAIRNKVGYPEKFRDYSAVEVRPGDFFGNMERATVFESRRQLAKIGKPVDRTEWGMTPPTVNAYYNPQMNDVNFPAGVLQPPLYDPKLDDAPNYGNTGSTIGHGDPGFDDEGASSTRMAPQIADQERREEVRGARVSATVRAVHGGRQSRSIAS